MPLACLTEVCTVAEVTGAEGPLRLDPSGEEEML